MDLSSLLVCADAKSVQIIGRVLIDMGIDVDYCQDPATALTRFGDQHFDILLVDFEDESAATALISQFRQSQGSRDVVVIAMVETRNNVRDIFAKGANFVLFKPVSAERMNKSVAASRTLIRGERRRTQRVPLDANASIAYASTENEAIRVLDLSETGISIHCGKSLPRNCKVYFQFSLPRETATIRLSSEVIWQNDAGHVGLRFVDVPTKSREVLNHWINTNVAGQLQVTQSSGPAEGTSSISQLASRLNLVSPNSPERRQQARHSCSIGAEVYRAGTHIQQRCVLTDISEGGCYVQTTEPLPPGTAVEIVLRTEDQKLRLYGKVQSMHRGMGMGIHINLRSVEQMQQLQQLIYQLEKPPVIC